MSLKWWNTSDDERSPPQQNDLVIRGSLLDSRVRDLYSNKQAGDDTTFLSATIIYPRRRVISPEPTRCVFSIVWLATVRRQPLFQGANNASTLPDAELLGLSAKPEDLWLTCGKTDSNVIERSAVITILFIG
jgi:hypothetical protein